MSDIKLPGIGNVPKPMLIAAGAATVGILGYAWWKHQSGGATTSDTTTDTSLDSSIDPATGVPYADEYGYMNSGYSFSGITDPSTGAIIGSGVGTGTVGTVTTNAAWSQAAQSYLSSIAGYESNAVAAALGAGLLGHYMTPDQVNIWNSAIAFEGYPPQGYPALNTTPPTGNPPPGPPATDANIAVWTSNGLWTLYDFGRTRSNPKNNVAEVIYQTNSHSNQTAFKTYLNHANYKLKIPVGIKLYYWK